jgi:hypothetical protein
VGSRAVDEADRAVVGSDDVRDEREPDAMPRVLIGASGKPFEDAGSLLWRHPRPGVVDTKQDMDGSSIPSDSPFAGYGRLGRGRRRSIRCDGRSNRRRTARPAPLA